MSSIVITIKNAKSVADLTSLYMNDTTNHRRTAINLQTLFHAFGAGNVGGTVDIQVAGTDPVASAGTVAVVFASAAAADTVTIAGQVLTCTLSAPTAGQFQKSVDGPTTAASLAAAINVHATLSKYYKATSAASTVTVTALQKGSMANLLSIATSNAPGFTVVSFAGGTGGVESAAVSYVRG